MPQDFNTKPKISPTKSAPRKPKDLTQSPPRQTKFCLTLAIYLDSCFPIYRRHRWTFAQVSKVGQNKIFSSDKSGLTKNPEALPATIKKLLAAPLGRQSYLSFKIIIDRHKQIFKK
jgi:hypothetical protein